MPHILFISYDGMTDPLGQSQVIPYLSGLTKFGYRFTIISCEKKEKFYKYKEQVKALLSPFPINWLPLTYHKFPPVISSIFDLIKIKITASRLHTKVPFDMVHTRSGTPALAGLWLKKKYGIKFLNDVRDFYAQSRIDSGQWKQNNPVYKQVYNYFRNKEQEERLMCDGIVCLTNKAKLIIKTDKTLYTGTPLEVIPCSVDLNLFNPENINLKVREALKTKLNIREDDIVFSYLGSIGSWYLTNDMMDLFKEILGTIPNAKFLFISPDDPGLIKKHAIKSGIDPERISFISGIRSEIPVLLSLSSYSVFFIKPCFSKQASSPTKLGEIMAMGIPVITNSGVGDVEEIIEKYQAGIVLKDLNTETYKKCANGILKIPFNSQTIRNGAIDFFDLKSAIHKYKTLYDNILSPRKKEELTSMSIHAVEK